jgi:glycerophosphoryl diester phosphodiesterase
MIFSGSAVWGHRGWPSRYPDNVVAGIRAASEVAAGVEIDVRRSSDGLLALSHDPELGGLVVADHPWSELANLDLGGHHPTRLDDVLDLPVTLDLEVKNDPREPGHESDHRIARDVADRARPGDVVTSFWWPSMDAVRQTHPDVATGLLVASPVDVHAALRHAVDAGHRSIAPEAALIDSALAAAAEREGVDLIAWTVDEAAEALRLARLGVAAIITNRPGELIAEDPTSKDPT